MVKPTANTEATIAFIRILEAIMCLLCLIAHIKGLNDEEPMPHIVLFCATFGGFFILSLAKLVVPLSGQVSPPGVDLVFSFLGFILFYIAACVAMFFVQSDPHLISVDGQPAKVDEETHPFFQRCVTHAMLSISTGTLFLMHAVISADRLTSMLKGIEEDIEREIDENDIDIFPDETISLHLFFINWLILIWNTACCYAMRKVLRKCYIRCIKYYQKKPPPIERRRHRRARVLRQSDLRRLNGITISQVAASEFIRNPRRSMAQDTLQSFVKSRSRESDSDAPQQGSSQVQMIAARRQKNDSWDESSAMYRFGSEYKAGDESPIEVTYTRNKAFGSDEDLAFNSAQRSSPNTTKQPRGVSFIRNKEFDSELKQRISDEDLNTTKQTKGVSFIRNEDFGNDINTSEMKTILKKASNTAEYDKSIDDYSSRKSPQRGVSFVGNEVFERGVQHISDENLRYNFAQPLTLSPLNITKQTGAPTFMRNDEFERDKNISKISDRPEIKTDFGRGVEQHKSDENLRYNFAPPLTPSPLITTKPTGAPTFMRNEDFGRDKNISGISSIPDIAESKTEIAENIDGDFLRNKNFESEVEHKMQTTSKSTDIASDLKSTKQKRKLFSFSRNKDLDDESETSSKISSKKLRKDKPEEIIQITGTLSAKSSKAGIDDTAPSESEIHSYKFENTINERSKHLQIKTSVTSFEPRFKVSENVLENNEKTTSETYLYNIHSSKTTTNYGQLPSLDNTNLIPYILTSTASKELEQTSDNQPIRSKQKPYSTTTQESNLETRGSEFSGLKCCQKNLKSGCSTSIDYPNAFPQLDTTSHLKPRTVPSKEYSEKCVCSKKKSKKKKSKNNKKEK